ncbi:oligopeptide/dipeptide ABC transporter ATP-binding protein [Candidatus Avelusimicrobium luingense]|uniref:oligopeptide/dipeptide ABC transporter ATP-binding protein n=1 Tax=Candidatus Avelusimicrobium luingense TaxID=3416211 RepID=UPI003D117E54
MSARVELQHIYKTYFRHKWLLGKGERVPVLKDVSLIIPQDRVVGLVGESGCGKSTLCKVLLGIEKPTAGTVLVNGQDVSRLNSVGRKNLCRQMQVVYQDPYSSLDPRMTVRQILAEPLDIHRLHTDPKKREQFLKELLTSVGLAASYLDRYPHEFSGGQRQRICIARALALDPQILVADEPVSALDVSVQAQILNLLSDIKRTRQLSVLFVTHDLAVARFLCDDIAVMYQGRIVEQAPAQELLDRPLHPYTKLLLAAVPQVGKPVAEAVMAGKQNNNVTGCPFAPRCPQASDACRQDVPDLQEQTSAHYVACVQLSKEK